MFGSEVSSACLWCGFFREVAGYCEDKFPILVSGTGIICGGDGMFVIEKRKRGVGRKHSKEHVYVVTERSARKIRRKVLQNKTAAVLDVFSIHICEGTVMMVDVGQENTYFDHSHLLKRCLRFRDQYTLTPMTHRRIHR